MTKGLVANAEELAARSEAPLNIDDITDRVYSRFTANSRVEISRDEVRMIVAGLDLAKLRPTLRVPRLIIRRLRFKGTKTLKNLDTPIHYDQSFKTGVNAIVIEDNLCGKSSVQKTIKFALTGNDVEYDQDVRKWITDIWLEFSLDKRPYTILLARREDGLHGRLATGNHRCRIENVPKANASKGFYHRGAEEVQQALESFFVHEFGLASLGWNQIHPAKDGSSMKVWASWLTYFQALRIPDDDHTYLLCKPEFANQDHLLFSAFLGLHLSEPLNRLSMEIASLGKSRDFSEKQIRETADKKAELVERLAKLNQQVTALEAEQSRRLELVTGGDLTVQLITAESGLVEGEARILAIKEQANNLTSQIQQCFAAARRLREQIDLSRELTGLQVSICPNCAQPIDLESMQRERASHQCRLCVRPVLRAAENESALLEAAAKEREQQAVGLKSRLAQVNRDYTEAQENAKSLRSTAETLRRTIKGDITKGLPTQEEVIQWGKLHEEIGRIGYEITILDQSTGGAGRPEDHERRTKIFKKVQLVLMEEADERNKEIEARLNELATGVIKALHADQISGIRCYPTGVVKLTKNGKNVAFSKIMNPGERYRAKLALFLAMIRLSREAGIGRHPGLLLLDQLGTGEMVPGDLQASAAALKKIEHDYSEKVQIICFTAKPEFREATVPQKVYGHRLITPSEKKCAF